MNANLFLLLLLCLSLPLNAQSTKKQSLAGTWYGHITHEGGGYTSQYNFELKLYHKGDTLTGHCYVSVDDIYAEISVTGTLHSGVLLQLKDIKILNSREFDGLEWCMKEYQLIFKRENKTDLLEGHWQGHTSFSTCIPGKVKLQRLSPRA
ncbi:MAG: hypothetical protein AAGG75_01560 [Bacteroidota bacterium]